MADLDKEALEKARLALYSAWSDGDFDEALGLTAVAIRAYLDAADGWRLMESAPKDGTEILAAIQVQKTDERNWWERHVIAFDEDLGEISGDYEHGWSWNDYTHWRPLPTPPEE